MSRGVQRIQTQAGVKKYGAPVGTPIAAGKVVHRIKTTAEILREPLPKASLGTPAQGAPVSRSDKPHVNPHLSETLRAEHARLNAKRDKKIKKLMKKGKYTEEKGNALRLKTAEKRKLAAQTETRAAIAARAK